MTLDADPPPDPVAVAHALNDFLDRLAAIVVAGLAKPAADPPPGGSDDDATRPNTTP